MLFFKRRSMNPKKLYHYFNRTERLLWISSVLLITAFFCCSTAEIR